MFSSRAGTTGSIIRRRTASSKKASAPAEIRSSLEFKKDDGSLGEESTLGMTLFSACIAVFFGVVDGLSLGAIIFPAGTDPMYTNLGMSIGLLTTLVVNFFLIWSAFPFSCGGAIIPQIGVIASYLATFGKDNPESIMVALPLVTAFTGLLVFIMGFITLVQEIVKMMPASVFGGFLAGTGVVIWQYGISLMYPTFTSWTGGSDDGVPSLFNEGALMLWLPGTVAGIITFLAQKSWLNHLKNSACISGNPSREAAVDTVQKYAMPLMLVIILIVFYIQLFATGSSMEEARKAGHLFTQTIPSHPSFYEVWTKQNFAKVEWGQVWNANLFMAVLKSFSMGFLTLVKNIYGSSEKTHTPVNIQRELKLAGIQNMVCGLTGGMPGGLIMSYSVTMNTMGVRSGKAFLLCQAGISVLAFVFGQYIIALCPKAIPGMMLMWVGFWLVIEWMWDLVGHVDNIEILLVWVMVVIDVVAGDSLMILFGLFVTFIITFSKYSSSPLFKGVVEPKGKIEEIRSEDWPDLTTLRSVIMRDMRSPSMKALNDWGSAALILSFEPVVLSFNNSFKVLDYIDDRLTYQEESEHKPPHFKDLKIVMLDFQHLIDYDVTALAMLRDLSVKAAEENFHLVLANMSMQFRVALYHFVGDNLYSANASGNIFKLQKIKTDGEETLTFVGDQQQDPDEKTKLSSKVGETLYGAPAESVKVQPGALVLANDQETVRNTEPQKVKICGMTLGLELVEQKLLALASESPESMQECQTSQVVFNDDLCKARKEVVDKTRLKDDDQMMGWCVRMHCLLNNFCQAGYEVGFLEKLVKQYLSIKNYPANSTIYDYSPEQAKTWEITNSGYKAFPAPPLIWMIKGEVAHYWTANRHEFDHAKHISKAYGLEENNVIEKAKHQIGDANVYCNGHFQTTAGFLASMPHLGSIIALKDSTCILLQPEQWQKLLEEDPQIANMILVYLGRTRFIELSVEFATGPKILL
jgi:SulP family sulfate permease